ncbi:MAG: polyprenyl synthetase family protein [Planctomycetota bacterium]
MSESSAGNPVDEVLRRSLYRPVQNFVQQQGKRIRAGLLEWSHAVCAGTTALPSEIAESIELIHAGSLVIDDVQDDSSERRSQPTMHRMLGTPLAINAGNYMYFRSLEILSQTPLTAEVRFRLVEELIRTGRVCHEGQAIDIATRVDVQPVSDWRAIGDAITCQKTGALVALSARLGAIAASASERMVSNLARFGMQVGIALQMRNDLEELRSFAEGGKRWDDFRNLRITWPWVWLAETECDQRARRYAMRAASEMKKNDLSGIRDLAGAIFDCVEGCGRTEIERRVDEPIAILSEHVLDAELLSEVKERLHSVRAGGDSRRRSRPSKAEVSS